MSVRNNKSGGTQDPAASVAEGANRPKTEAEDDQVRDGHRDPVMEAAAEEHAGGRQDNRREPTAEMKEAAEANAQTGPDGLTTVDREQKYGVIPEMSGPGGLPGTENRV